MAAQHRSQYMIWKGKTVMLISVSLISSTAASTLNIEGFAALCQADSGNLWQACIQAS